LPKLPVVSGTEVVAALRRAGFVRRNQVGSHVALKHPGTGAKASVPVRSARDLPAGTLRRIIRDAGLTVEGFCELLGK
jgi:predicted RNA binding protein YcfA (HicA-like mRNA interferase family)